MDDDDPIREIFFEHQKAALCAQHALNMLLQDDVFTSEDLRIYARELDTREHEILGNGANEVGRSENMDDSGYFSIQVIEKALAAFYLTITNIENPAVADIKNNPLTARAFICNLHAHWLVIRKFGDQWFELNSTLQGPRLLSDTYTCEYLHQVSVEGYSIFVVQGDLPPSHADQLISLIPVVPRPRVERKEPNMVQKLFNSVGKRLGGGVPPDSQEDKDLAIAMAMSMEPQPTNEDEKLLQRALAESLKVAPSTSDSSGAPEDMDSDSVSPNPPQPTELVETPILASTDNSPRNIPNAEQQRRDRQKFLEILEQKKSK